MKFDFKKLDFVNIEMGDKSFVAVVVKKTKSRLIILPIPDFENPAEMDNDKLMTGISVSKGAITAYHQLSSDQVDSIIYLLGVNNSWIQKAVERALNE